MSVDLTRAVAIPKGCSVADLKWLAKAAGGKQRIVELGTFHGRSVRAMLDNSEAHIWCIDRYVGTRPKAGPGQSHGLRVEESDFRIFLENIVDIRSRVIILKMSTREATGLLPDGCFDMVFIDADHRYDTVKADIMEYAPLLREGGLLCGHDRSWRGVKKAVNESITYPREGGAEIWWTIREEGWMKGEGIDRFDGSLANPRTVIYVCSRLAAPSGVS